MHGVSDTTGMIERPANVILLAEALQDRYRETRRAWAEAIGVPYEEDGGRPIVRTPATIAKENEALP